MSYKMRAYILLLFIAVIKGKLVKEKCEVDYKGYSVFQIKFSGTDKAALFVNNSRQFSLDFWSNGEEDTGPIVMVSRKKKPKFESFLKENEFNYKVRIEDVQKWLDDNREHKQKRNSFDKFFDDYRNWNEVYDYIQHLKSKYNHLVDIVTIGASHQNRKLIVMKIGVKASHDKPIIWIDAGTHAREWITIASSLFVATKLLRRVDVDKEVKRLLQEYDWYIMPVVNPDGYEYSHICDRLWRKNRSPNHCREPSEIGTDLNRNFGFRWSRPELYSRETREQLEDPCTEIYAGRMPFSEKETKAISEFLTDHKEKTKMYISLHSFGQAFLTPYLYQSERAFPDKDEMVALAKIGAEALRKWHGTVYNVERRGNLAYSAAGTSLDYMYGILDIKYSYIIEMRDRGETFFKLSKKQIVPASEELYEGIKAMAVALVDKAK